MRKWRFRREFVRFSNPISYTPNSTTRMPGETVAVRNLRTTNEEYVPSREDQR
jgi:hypothetical protein